MFFKIRSQILDLRESLTKLEQRQNCTEGQHVWAANRSMSGWFITWAHCYKAAEYKDISPYWLRTLNNAMPVSNEGL